MEGTDLSTRSEISNSAALPDTGQFQQQLRDVNEALLVSSVHQHELAEQAHTAEAALRESEERYRTLFDLRALAVYSCDVSGVIQNYNWRAAELWGLQARARRYRRAILRLLQIIPAGRHLHAPRNVRCPKSSRVEYPLCTMGRCSSSDRRPE
jgi:PAS domain-containing protein